MSDIDDIRPDARPSEVGGGYFQQAAAELARWMHDAFSIGPALETGTLMLRGTPNVRIGEYLRIKEQQREFYVEGVRHTFSIWPRPIHRTMVDVTRGMWMKNNPYADLYEWL